MRGTPHTHSLCCVCKDAINEKTISQQNPIALYELVSKTITANIPRRHENDVSGLENLNVEDITDTMDYEKSWTFNTTKEYFDDRTDPRRQRFHPDINYCRAIKCDVNRGDESIDVDAEHPSENITGTGALIQDDIQCSIAELLYRRSLLANQMHQCCFTCHKYNSSGERKCRFCFPWDDNSTSATTTTIKIDRDPKNRVRQRAFPPRNNGNLNVSAVDPLLVIAHGGNHDIQYIDNAVGAAEYSGSYASKAEEPDGKAMRAAYIKKIAKLAESNVPTTDRQRLNAIANAIVSSTQIGTVQACYTLLGLSYVKSSRMHVNVNSLKGTYSFYNIYIF